MQIKRVLLALFVFLSALQASAQIKIGVCTKIDNASKVAQAGGDFIEESVGRFLCPDKSDEEFGKNLEALSKSPLPVLSCNGFLPKEIRIVGPEADHAAALRWAETALRRASRAGISYIVFGSSKSRRVPEGWTKEEAMEQFISLLKKIGPIARKYNVTIVLEPLRSEECNLLNTVEDGCGIVRKVRQKNIRCLADIYHMLCEKEGPEVLVRNAKYIKHCHVAEFQDRSAPGTHGEDLSSYYNALKQAGYKGGLSVEGRWDDFDSQIGTAMTVLRSGTSEK